MDWEDGTFADITDTWLSGWTDYIRSNINQKVKACLNRMKISVCRLKGLSAIQLPLPKMRPVPKPLMAVISNYQGWRMKAYRHPLRKEQLTYQKTRVHSGFRLLL